MDKTTLGAKIETNLVVAVLAGSVATTVIATQLAAGNLSGEGVMQNLMTVGAPSAVGGLVASLAIPLSNASPKADMRRGLIAGAATVTVLVATGAIPYLLDTQMAVLFGTVAAGTMIGDYVSNLTN